MLDDRPGGTPEADRCRVDEALSQILTAQGLPEISSGIGLHTGLVVAASTRSWATR
ncbi:hypothetical protein [Pseudonocardia pini]|uniref:hypothetical protein n=1 Tax=Pseudonocardia pini TaxID=2758030 RepID=UPI0015F0AF8C|nr:hypothetical protein [Pseudonocardia pini]